MNIMDEKFKQLEDLMGDYLEICTHCSTCKFGKIIIETSEQKYTACDLIDEILKIK